VRKGTPEGRRLFAWCLAFGVLAGVVADVLVLSSFASAARYVPCRPDNPSDPGSCPELDLVGFALNSKLEAALTVGPIVGLLGFVVCTVFVLLSAEQRRDH
jgi:hypothetical protein